MRLAVCLYKYFPYSGLARDFIRIMRATIKPNDHVDVFVMEWEGDIPNYFNVIVLGASGLTNHGKMVSYQSRLEPILNNGGYDVVLGFNKMPGLDIYYAADPCYLDRVKSHSLYFLLKLTGRVRALSKAEKAVFEEQSSTVSLMISDVQRDLFRKHYRTPIHRLISLPPGISEDRKRPKNADEIRNRLRAELGISNDEWFLLCIGSSFHTKGIDRAIDAFHELPETLQSKTHLYILGEGKQAPLVKQATRLGIEKHVHFLGGRTDVPRFLLGADLLVHPARKENTGTVILEAIVAGLPVLVSDVCGYAHHVINADAGLLISPPDNPKTMARDLEKMLNAEVLNLFSRNGLNYADVEDLYSMPEKVAAIIRQKAT